MNTPRIQYPGNKCSTDNRKTRDKIQYLFVATPDPFVTYTTSEQHQWLSVDQKYDPFTEHRVTSVFLAPLQNTWT
jgi:hypothetical protein